MLLDLRFPMGLLFAALGFLLLGYGLASGPAVYAPSLGINVNVWAGGGMLAFGLAMLAGAWRAARLQRLRSVRMTRPTEPSSSPTTPRTT